MRNLKKVVLGLLISLMVVGCSSAPKAVTIDVQATLEGIVEKFYTEMAPIAYDAEYVEFMYGLTAEQYESFAGIYPMISAVATDVAVFEAKEGKVEEVKTAVEAYKETKKANAWYPAETENAENAIIYVNGNYVFFIMAENAAETETYVKSLFGE